MSSPSRILRFRFVGSGGLARPETRIVLEVILDEAMTAAGHVVELPASHGAPLRWSYVLSDGRATGLQSSLSRRDLQSQICDFYFQELVSDRRQSA